MTIPGDNPPPTGLPEEDDPVGGTGLGKESNIGPVVNEEPEDVSDFKKAPGPVDSGVDLEHAKAAKNLAYIFAAALAVMFLMNIGAVVWLTWGQPVKESLEPVNHVFSIWIPIFSGFVASAVTFYYTQNKR